MGGSDFLTELHAGFEAPRAAVVDLVTRATGRAVDELERLALGDENEVHRARLDDAAVVYARIRRPGAGTFDAEVRAMEQARAAGTPVPRILAVEELRSESVPRSAMVIATAPGRQLAEVLPTLDERQRQRAMTNLGRTLAGIHTVATPGVDRPGPDGVWPDPEAARRALITERTGQRPHLVTAGLTAAEIDAALAQVGRSPDTPAATDPVLCHGDLHANHVFVDDDLAVRGVIDWGLWHGGSVVGDLATMTMAYGPTDFAAILAGHGAGTDTPDLPRRLAASVIIQAIGHIAWHQSIGNADGTAHYVARLRAALAELGPGPG